MAWNNAYELISENDTLVKKAYKKTGLNTFSLDKTFTKASLNEVWSTLGKIFEFDGDLSGLSSVKLENVYYVKVSDKFFDTNDLIGSTINLVGKVGDEEIEPSTYTITEANIGEESIEDEATNETGKLIGVFIEDAGEKALLFSFTMNFAGFESGTYFVTDIFEEGCAYTKSISCLTEADIVPALTNRLTPEEIFDLFAWKGKNESDLVVIDYKDAKYLKVSDKAFSPSEVSFHTLSMWFKAYSTDNPAESVNTLSGIVRPEHITHIVEDTEIDIIEVSLIACSEQLPGYISGGDSTAVISVANNCVYNGVTFEKGTYFLETGSIGIRSISCLAATDTYAL